MRLKVGENSACDTLLDSLPGSLTRLEVWDARKAARFADGDSYQALRPEGLQLGNLQHLMLRDCRLLPAVLHSMAQLQHLELHRCVLLPYDVHRSKPEAIAALLRGIAPLTALRHLEMASLELHTAPPPYAAFSALTAASNALTALLLRGDTDGPLPQGAMRDLVPAGRRLPHLRTLAVARNRGIRPAPCINGDDLPRMLTACPNLEALDISKALQSGADLSALLRMPQTCRSLVGGSDNFRHASIAVLVQLTHLTHLKIQEHSMRCADIEQLTALRGLKDLDVPRGPMMRLGDTRESRVFPIRLQESDEEVRAFEGRVSLAALLMCVSQWIGTLSSVVFVGDKRAAACSNTDLLHMCCLCLHCHCLCVSCHLLLSPAPVCAGPVEAAASAV